MASRLLSAHRRGSEPPFHLFIDETRTENQFCLTGCIIGAQEHFNLIHQRFESMKTDFFPESHTSINPIVFRRREIANSEPPFRFASPQRQKDFQKKLFQVLLDARFSVIFAIATYNTALANGDRAADAYARCLRFLLFRYAGYLYHQRARGDVFAEHVGKQEDEFLKSEYFRTRSINGAEGESFRYFQDVFTSKDLHIEDKSKNIGGLQVADLLAAPLMRNWLSSNGKPFDQLMAEVGCSKLNRRFCDGTTDGYARRLL
jgi:Protein of unknown function (DUF3800)